MYKGYSCIDCDSHVLEPADLWEKYLDPEFRDEAPRSSWNHGYWVTGFGHPEGRGYADALDEILAIETISEETRRRILWDNAARLYGIESAR